MSMPTAERRAFPVRTWQEVMAMENDRGFVIDGLVCTTSTLLVAEPKAGKSLLGASILGALLTGEPLLGREVRVPDGGWRIALCWTDDNAEAEYRDRLMTILPKGLEPAVRFYRVSEIDGKGWSRLHSEIKADGCNFVIFDVMNQALCGSANDDKVVTDFFRGVRECTRNSIPVLLIVHSSEKTGEHGKSKNPLGSTQISGNARWIISLTRNASGVWTLETKGSVADICAIRFTAPEFDVPRFEIGKEVSGVEKRTSSRQRSTATLNRNGEIAAYVVAECQGLSQADTAARISAKWNLRKSGCVSNLSGGRGYGALLQRDGDTWRLSRPQEVAA